MKNSNAKRYLVTYKDEKTDSSKAFSLLEKKGTMNEGLSFMAFNRNPGKDDILHFEKLGISSVELTPEEAEGLSRKNDILAVEEDVEMHILGFPSDTQPFESMVNAAAGPLWNMNLIHAPEAWSKGVDGQGINVAILDTGIATHPNLVISGGISFIPGVTSFNDGNGHGSHCAGIVGARNGLNNVYGVAPQCNLYAVKVLSDSGSGDSSWIISGMEWCIANGIKVISMSLGSESLPSVAWANAIKACQDNGIIVVCAAGNSFGDTSFPWVCSPANSFISGSLNTSPIAVGAVDSGKVIASFSSRGGQNSDWNQVTVVAPGVNIYSTYPGNRYQTMSGTSMACPHVAGLAALVSQRFPAFSPNQVMNKIASTTSPLGLAPYPNIPYGAGLINCDLATS